MRETRPELPRLSRFKLFLFWLVTAISVMMLQTGQQLKLRASWSKTTLNVGSYGLYYNSSSSELSLLKDGLPLHQCLLNVILYPLKANWQLGIREKCLRATLPKFLKNNRREIIYFKAYRQCSWGSLHFCLTTCYGSLFTQFSKICQLTCVLYAQQPMIWFSNATAIWGVLSST